MVRKSKSGYSVALQSFQVGWKVEAKETVLKVQGTGAGGGEGGVEDATSLAPCPRGGQKLLVPLDRLFPEKSLHPPNVGCQVNPGQTDSRVGRLHRSPGPNPPPGLMRAGRRAAPESYSLLKLVDLFGVILQLCGRRKKKNQSKSCLICGRKEEHAGRQRRVLPFSLSLR